MRSVFSGTGPVERTFVVRSPPATLPSAGCCDEGAATLELAAEIAAAAPAGAQDEDGSDEEAVSAHAGVTFSNACTGRRS